MDFRIADTFTDSLARLTGDEQKAVKTTAFDLQMNPASPGLSFHKLDKAKDKNFWSVRVNADIRLIVHKTGGSMLLCYVDHHDKAYGWAERRKLETHPATGAAQLVEIRETFKEIVVPVYVSAPEPANPAKAESRLFEDMDDAALLGYGVPSEWLPDVKKATETSLLVLAEHLPAEAAEALLELATGGKPQPVPVATTTPTPFDHPDAQRRFRTLKNADELQAALDYPWDKWTVFLHPEQRQLVERDFNGPARVAGSAGTGKTIVALHRAVHLARRNPDARVLLTTFNDVLAESLFAKLKRLLAAEPMLGERIDVFSLPVIANRLHKAKVGPVSIAPAEIVRQLLAESAKATGLTGITNQFLWAEWEHVVDPWQVQSWEQFRDLARLGRKTRLPEARRQAIWQIFDAARKELATRGLKTQAEVFAALSAALRNDKRPAFDHVVVDEAQDLGVPHLRFLASLAPSGGNALFFAGDQGQRIFQQPFSWRALGVDIRGRSRGLRVNYRTSHQIRSQADRLLARSVADADGNVEERSDTVSVFNGPAPDLRVFATAQDESASVAEWLKERVSEGMQLQECAVFVRSEAQLPRARAAVNGSGLGFRVLDDKAHAPDDAVSISTMQLAKGLEFRAVAVMACDDEVVPLQERISDVGDEADLRDAYETERHLLYVACTRARDRLIVTGVKPESEFLEDMRR
ncbi:MAG: UvrD-helicase domain-containing protein [Planctomycetes bacterium]|nr:UvrD-helicase domain-containing protein [Planctomycetota bacterium]